jgi:hypothetical protein
VQGTTYRSRVDVLAVTLLIGVVIIVGGFLFRSASSIVPFLLAVLVGLGLTLWLWRSTSYVLDRWELRIRCCGMQWRVPIGAISDVGPVFSVAAAPALSFNRIEIVYGSKNSIMISPRSEAAFLSELEQRRQEGLKGAGARNAWRPS